MFESEFLSAQIKRLGMQLNHKYDLDKIETIIQELFVLNQFKQDVYFKVVFLISGKGSWSGIFNVDLLIVPWKLDRAFNKNKKSLCLFVSKWEISLEQIENIENIFEHIFSSQCGMPQALEDLFFA